MALSGQRTAIVTGAASGIGFEIVRHMLENNFAVVFNDLDSNLLAKASEELKESTGNNALEAIAGDASQTDTISTLVETAERKFGRLDVAIANAGITTFGSFLDYPTDQLNKLLSVNLQGSFCLAQQAAKKMIEQNTHGRILFMSSVTGYQYHPNLAAYGMTKSALRMLAKSLGAELAKHGITVNGIAPGATATERTLLDPDYNKEWSTFTPTGHVSTPSDIAHAVMFLISEEARQITGQTLVVDGGWTLTSPVPE